MANKISKSVRKYIRQEKGRLRSQIKDEKELEEALNNVYQKFGIQRQAVENTNPKSQ